MNGLSHEKEALDLEPRYTSMLVHLDKEMAEAERKAFDALGRYKFAMFGYWAAIWVHLNRISGADQPNPFRLLVKTARERARE